MLVIPLYTQIESGVSLSLGAELWRTLILHVYCLYLRIPTIPNTTQTYYLTYYSNLLFHIPYDSNLLQYRIYSLIRRGFGTNISGF